MGRYVALITDTHAGIRGDSEHFQKNQERFYQDIFFPVCEEYDISEVFHLGDMFDRRKFINFKTLYRYNNHFLKPLWERGMKMHLIVGNHDVAYKNTNEVNSPTLLLSSYENILQYVHEPVKVDLSEGNSILMVPWINNQNYDDVMKTIKQTDANICFGHFEFTGFEMHAGQPSQEGMSTQGFDKFDMVCSGHFHHRSTRGNITYLGAPFEYTWSDYDDERGFHIMDIDTLELTYFKNPYTMFEKVLYSDNNKDSMLQYARKADIEGKIVKVVVKQKNDPYLFDRVLDILYAKSPYDMQVVDLVAMDIGDVTDDDVDESTKDTVTLIQEYVDTICDDGDTSEQVNALMKELYTEALSEE